MKVFIIDSSLNLMLSLVVLTQVTMQLRIHGLFYLTLLHINTLVCDFEILLKGLDHQ